MECPNCGYMLDAFDKECPRCKRFSVKDSEHAKYPSLDHAVETGLPVEKKPHKFHCLTCKIELPLNAVGCPNCDGVKLVSDNTTFSLEPEFETSSDKQHYCIQCRLQLPSSASFCSACGTPTGRTVSPLVSTVKSVDMSNQTATGVWPAVLKTLIVVVGIVVGMFLLFPSNFAFDKQESDTSTTATTDAITEEPQPATPKVEVIETYITNTAYGWSIKGTAQINEDFNGYINFDLLDASGTIIDKTIAGVTNAKAGQQVSFSTLPVSNSQVTKYSASGLTDLSIRRVGQEVEDRRRRIEQEAEDKSLRRVLQEAEDDLNQINREVRNLERAVRSIPNF